MGRTNSRYWIIRAWVEGWVLLLVRRGPRAFWKGLTHAPYRSALRFGFSTVTEGYNPEPDVAVILTPPGPAVPDASIISARRVRDFIRTVAPGAAFEPRLCALVALEEEHGCRSLTGDPLKDAFGTPTCGPYLSVEATGRLSLRTRRIHRPPFEDAHLFEDPLSDSEPLFMDQDPFYDTDPLFDVVDVLMPLYLAATAVSSGAYDRLVHPPGGSKNRRYSWNLDIEERIAFPTPRGGPSPVGFPGRIPSRIPPGSPRPEPSTTWVWGRNLARHTLPARVPRRLGPERAAGPLGLRERHRGRGRGGGRARETQDGSPYPTASLTVEALFADARYPATGSALQRGLDFSDHAPEQVTHIHLWCLARCRAEALRNGNGRTAEHDKAHPARPQGAANSNCVCEGTLRALKGRRRHVDASAWPSLDHPGWNMTGQENREIVAVDVLWTFLCGRPQLNVAPKI